MKWEDYRHNEFLEPERVEGTLVKKLQGSVHVTQFENVHVLCVWFSSDDCYGQIYSHVSSYWRSYNEVTR